MLAVTAASSDTQTEDGDIALRGLERLENTIVAALRDTEQATRLAAVIAKTGLDMGDAHVAAVADASAGQILTLDAAKWQGHAEDLDEPLQYVLVADPPDLADGRAPE